MVSFTDYMMSRNAVTPIGDDTLILVRGGVAKRCAVDDIVGLGGSYNSTNYVTNPQLRRAYTKAASIVRGDSSARLNLVFLGDSISPFLRESIDARLKLEYANGGFAGRLAGETGFNYDGNATSASETSGNFTNSPNGCYWDVASGGSFYVGVGNVSNTNPMAAYAPSVFLAPSTVTRIGVYYTRRPGGGTFKVQISTKTSSGSFSDVTGLTSVDTNGTLSIQYVEVAISAADVSRLKIVHVSGSNCYIVGGLVSADVGVVSHGWHVGGLAMTNMINSARFTEWAALVPADVVIAAYLDAPGDSSYSTGMTETQLVDAVSDGIRNAFPATSAVTSTTPWSGKTALVNRRPHLVLWGSNKVETPGTVDQDAYNAAMNANAVANDDTYFDANSMWGSWRDVYDVGGMGGGDSSGSSTHPAFEYYLACAAAFLTETNLIGGGLAIGLREQSIERLRVGPTAVAANNKANRVKFSDSVTSISFAPLDRTGFGDIAMMIESSGAVYECGLWLKSTAASGCEYLITHQPGAGFLLRDTTASKTFLQYNASAQLALGASGGTVAIGNIGTHQSGTRHGRATLSSGTVTVTDANITANSRIIVTRTTRGGTVGATYEAVPTSGSFTITSRTAADAVASSDTSVLSWIAIEP